MKISDSLSMNDSALAYKCVEHAVYVMQFMEGKENLFALGKVFLCCLFLGVP